MTDLLARLKAIIGFNPLSWAGHARRMARRVDEFDIPAFTRAGAPRFLVVVTPWLGSGIPWFSLAIGLMLAARGASVTFVVDHQRFGPGAARHAIVLAAIRHVMRRVARRVPVIDLRDVAPLAADEAARTLAQRLSKLNAIWALRGETSVPGRAAFEARARRQLDAAAGPIAAVLRDAPYDALFVPGGVYGLSGLWVAAARAAGIRVATYDNASYGTWMIAVDGLACHLADVPRAFAQISDRCDADRDEESRALGAADEQIDQRRRGVDAFQSQVKNADRVGDALAGGVLLALNSSWDSAALGPHVVFANNSEWIVETVRHLLATTQVPVIVRQHPAERLAFAYTSDDYRALLATNFGDHHRLHFIAAEDPINSYELLGRVGTVVVHTSTIGIEAAIFGKPVVTASAAYFADLGFVWRARDLASYHRLLATAVARELVVTAPMQRAARLCFYVTQCCNWVVSPFNPEEFKGWSRVPLAKFATEPATERMLAAMVRDVPVALLNHEALMASSTASARAA